MFFPDIECDINVDLSMCGGKRNPHIPDCIKPKNVFPMPFMSGTGTIGRGVLEAEAGTYTLSFYGSLRNVSITFSGDGQMIFYQFGSTSTDFRNYSQVITLPADNMEFYFSAPTYAELKYIQLEAGTEATDYEPHDRYYCLLTEPRFKMCEG